MCGVGEGVPVPPVYPPRGGGGVPGSGGGGGWGVCRQPLPRVHGGVACPPCGGGGGRGGEGGHTHTTQHPRHPSGANLLGPGPLFHGETILAVVLLLFLQQVGLPFRGELDVPPVGLYGRLEDGEFSLQDSRDSVCHVCDVSVVFLIEFDNVRPLR